MSAPLPTGRILPDLTQRSAPAAGQFARVDNDTLRRLFEAGASDDEMATHFGCTVQTIRVHRSALRLLRPRGPRVGKKRSRNSRHPAKPLVGRVSARMPPFDHPALASAQTIYPNSVLSARGLPNILVSGANSHKIGAMIEKGRWRGFPVFTLTLEERATCPTTCAMWRSCYGNGMPWARRIVHDPDFERRLERDVHALAARHRGGFAVRLHVLGDFYSVPYAALWRRLVERHANLHVFGFTARIRPDDPITHALHDLVVDHWPRVALRFSNAPTPILSTVTIEHPLQRPVDAIICPAQLGRTASCSTCALCWQTERRIAFLRH